MPVLHPSMLESTPLMWVLIVVGWIVLAVTLYGVLQNWRHRG